MQHHHTPIEYGDSLKLQLQLSKVVDRAVVKFVNRSNDNPDELGFGDPLFHLPDPAASVARMCAFRRWHGADWWMVLGEDAGEAPIGRTITRRVTILPDSIEPDTLDFLPDLIVTRGGARFALPEDAWRYREHRQQLPSAFVYRLLLLETSKSQRLELEELIIGLLSKAWQYACEFDPSQATVFVSS